jgi:hypothetical protein
MTLSNRLTWKAYLNGALVLNFQAQQEISNVNFTKNLIGTSNWPVDPPYVGFMDEFRMYSRELDADEIGAIYSWRGGPGACRPCPPGTASGVGGLTACATCAAGTYASGEGGSACDPCPPGSYASGAGQSACAACAAGAFVDAAGQSSCTACSAGKYNT